MPRSVDDYLSDSNYEKVDGWKFDRVGATIAGQIVGSPRVVDFDDIDTGEKVEKLVLNVADQATAKTWAVWASGRMAGAIAKALRASGARRLEDGGTIAIRYTADGERSKPQFSPPKLYDAHYTPPAAGVSADQLANLTGGTPQQPTPPPQQAWPAGHSYQVPGQQLAPQPQPDLSGLG